ncbi:putative transport protein [Allocatelliglobosispora scoriae]|uniref:Putative transport protein n=1 Tax=Allocatelliglobosispora scoriae TaxID=643052 RepID=A0A841BZJ9_9ACTN|nr:DUF5655 domain-containing protein [Allocatelliglobosispora scoriae]MBB5874587.1 putative transport protein [Allocatelliglobosispora scoriae]
MPDPAAALASQLRNIEQGTGRSTVQWAALINATGLAKHGQIVSFLKSEHGLTHGNANTLAHAVREHQAGGPPPESDLLDAQYQGAKSALRPVYDEVVAVARALGDDVTVTVQKTGVSLRRHKQFALVQAPSSRHVQLGLNLKDTPATPRLQALSGMCSHRVHLTDVDDIDDEVAGWLRLAYGQA